MHTSVDLCNTLSVVECCPFDNEELNELRVCLELGDMVDVEFLDDNEGDDEHVSDCVDILAMLWLVDVSFVVFRRRTSDEEPLVEYKEPLFTSLIAVVLIFVEFTIPSPLKLSTSLFIAVISSFIKATGLFESICNTEWPSFSNRN